MKQGAWFTGRSIEGRYKNMLIPGLGLSSSNTPTIIFGNSQPLYRRSIMSTSSTPDIGDDIEDFDFFGWWESFANSPISPFDLIPVDTVDTAEVVASSFSFWAEHAPLDGYIAADPSDDIILSQTQQPDTITRSQREQSVMVISDDETMRKTRVEKQQPRNFKTRSRARGTRQRKSRTGREAQPTGPRRSQRKRSQPASYRTVMMFDFDEVILLD